jgi:hypothetical protein
VHFFPSSSMQKRKCTHVRTWNSSWVQLGKNLEEVKRYKLRIYSLFRTLWKLFWKNMIFSGWRDIRILDLLERDSHSMSDRIPYTVRMYGVLYVPQHGAKAEVKWFASVWRTEHGGRVRVTHQDPVAKCCGYNLAAKLQLFCEKWSKQFNKVKPFGFICAAHY